MIHESSPRVERDQPTPRPKQLWLFPPPRPLKERFEREFFLSLPREPGVYFFFDRDGRLIYIGKAKCLRDRIGSYRYVQPDRGSRKTWRLVNEVHRIEWQVCANHEEALLQESQLLREHRPRFNRANVWPWSAVYIGLRQENDELEFCVARDLNDDYEWFGAFKAFAIYAFSALQRTLRYVADPARAPIGWFGWDCGRSFKVSSLQLSIEQLRTFLEGQSKQFLETIESARAADCRQDLAQQNLVLNDLILLEEFFERGPRRNRQIKTDGELVTPEELVDWLAVRSA